MENKKKGIAISLILALIFTGAIFYMSNKKYIESNKTVKVAAADKYIPAGSKLTKSNVKKISVPEEISGDLVKNPEELLGKSSVVSLVSGQFLRKNMIDVGLPQKKGYETVFIPTDLSSSACVIAGERVNIYLTSRGERGQYNSNEPVYKGALVRYAKDQSGKELKPEDKNKLSKAASNGRQIPVSIAVEVPPQIAKKLVDPAKNNALYLTRSEVEK